ncbi:hypothetical protein ANN_06796 [Periplaneta americana]|uniref:Uncharacterized protein n=1 Tax=Periplaneta americana TaxID=6978 RepID=A0ABQ8TGE7_PERAM|nr:hypothetical protein ANN_06796 [Periplaneta americana]
MTRPVERDAPVKDDTDTSSESAEVTNVVTDRTEQPTLETTDRTEDTTAEEVNTDGRNAAPELMETTVIPPESKSPSQFGDASLEVLHFEEHHDDKGALLSVDFNKALIWLITNTYNKS